MTAAVPQTSVFQNFVSGQSVIDSGVSAFTRPARSVRLNGYPCSAWYQSLESRYNSLTALPKGWDGYAGRPVSYDCAQFAAQLLERLYDEEVPPPSLVPGSDGTLQIEWHRNQYDIEVDVLGPYKVIASRYDCLTKIDEEFELEADFTVLASWINDLKSDRQNEPVVGAAQL